MMLNYGSSITSAFPNTFCSSPESLLCQLCNTSFKDKYANGSKFIQSLMNQHYSGGIKLEKCTHCGINICESCFNENQEAIFENQSMPNIHNKLRYEQKPRLSQNSTQSNIHYNIVKKEFKQLYNYSKEIVEKLHLLNNAIKVEESAVTELNLIKHQVNTKALDLVKQINQEKTNLIEQIENVKKKYETTLNDRKEYYALSMQYKDELRKVIKKYKDYKSEEQCSLNDLLKMYFSVKSISKNLDDYDHIKLITEQNPLQVKFEEKAIFRNLIGKLLLNGSDFIEENLPENFINRGESLNNREINKIKEQITLVDKNLNRNQLMGALKILENRNVKLMSKSRQTFEDVPISSLNEKTNKPQKQDISRSFSLNDLISAANELISQQSENNKDITAYTSLDIDNSTNNLKLKNYLPKSYQNLNKLNDYNEDEKISYNTIKNENKSFREMNFNKSLDSNNYPNQQNYGDLFKQQGFHKEKLLSSSTKQIIQSTTPPFQTSPISKSHFMPPINKKYQQNTPTTNIQSILKNSSNQPASKYLSGSGHNLENENTEQATNNDIQAAETSNESLNAMIELFKLKQSPKQRLEIDILPSHLSCSKTKLLIASSFGRIRVIDLFSYKIQKDELKNLLINGICLPKARTEITSLCENNNSVEILYAITNGSMNETEDVLNVSNSCIVVTNHELKILKKENETENDDYVFVNPSGICYDDYGNLYICDSGFNRVKVLDPNLMLINTITTATNPQDYLSQPKSVTTFQNMLFICDSANHRIVSYYINKNGAEFKFKGSYGLGYGEVAGMLKYPLECCVDNAGILYVRDHHNNRVQLFNADGVPFHHIEVNSQRETIYSMTVAENGDIYVAKMVHIQESDQNGQMNTINKYYIDIY